MNRRQRVKDQLLLDYVLQQQPALLERLLEAPQSVFERIGVSADALSCPDEVHQAIARAERAAEAANALADKSPAEALPELAAIARGRLGKEATAVKIPFGIRFSEQVSDDVGLDATATGTVECTFRIRCSPDHDG
jgi:hypothetical protein